MTHTHTHTKYDLVPPVRSPDRVSFRPFFLAAASKVSSTPVMLDTYWEGKAPPSDVLGPALAKAPSGGLGIVSLVAFAVGTFCIHETNILHTVSPDSIQPLYVAGALLVPISWGLHVASWIQKQNGK